jgi:hypothetical protein
MVQSTCRSRSRTSPYFNILVKKITASSSLTVLLCKYIYPSGIFCFNKYQFWENISAEINYKKPTHINVFFSPVIKVMFFYWKLEEFLFCHYFWTHHGKIYTTDLTNYYHQLLIQHTTKYTRWIYIWYQWYGLGLCSCRQFSSPYTHMYDEKVIIL